jgi:hypothetical protein
VTPDPYSWIDDEDDPQHYAPEESMVKPDPYDPVGDALGKAIFGNITPADFEEEEAERVRTWRDEMPKVPYTARQPDEPNVLSAEYRRSPEDAWRAYHKGVDAFLEWDRFLTQQRAARHDPVVEGDEPFCARCRRPAWVRPHPRGPRRWFRNWQRRRAR